MKLAYFPNHCALNSAVPMRAFLQSCQRYGIELAENSMDADAAVIWSVTWTGRMSGNQQIYKYYRQTGRPVIVLEVGAIHRGHTWKVAINNITADGFYGHQTALDHDRPKKLKIPTFKCSTTKKSILVVAQNNCSLQVEKLQSIDHWIQDTVAKLRSYTDRLIIIRPHPRSRCGIQMLPNNVFIETPKKLANTYDSYNIDYCHHAVINYNSGAGVQAAIAGSTIVVDSSSLAYPVAIDLSLIEQPQSIDRLQWLIEISHTEYLTEEIESGQWISRLAPQLLL
jgi:Ni,Fe-hydrogenase III small subunit